jgi:acyl-CoA synthetase (AMP-forming)/AMP-acid ligase II
MTETLAGGAPHLTRLCDYVRHYAARQGERDALVFNQTRISYRAFDELIDRCAAALTDAGVQPGDRVAMLTTPRPEFAIVLMAAQRVGAIWVGLNTRYRLPELRYILGDCTPRLLISLTETPDGRSFESDLRALKAETGTQIITFPAAIPGIGPSLDEVMNDENPARAPASAATENDPTVIVYTSGTTGRP